MEKSLNLLRWIFRIFAIPLSHEDHILWKLYTFIVIFSLLISLIGVIASAIDKLNEDIFSSISAILFCSNGFFSYICLTFTVYIYPQCNLIEILKKMAQVERSVENNLLVPSNTENPLLNESQLYHPDLKVFCYKWLKIAGGIGLFSYSLLFVAYGVNADTHFFDVGNNPGWHVGNILYIYVNIGWLLPMVIVRVGSYFLEEKIFGFLEYLEQPESRTTTSHRSQSSHIHSIENDSQRSCILSRRLLLAIRSQTSSDVVFTDSPLNSLRSNVITSFSQLSIRQVMSWYDELYLLNQSLSDALSLIIFQAIFGLFPIVVFMLQVNQIDSKV